MKNSNNPRIDIVYDFRREASDKKTGAIHIRVYYTKKKRTYASTGVRVYPHEWSDQWHVINRSDAATLNKIIDKAYKNAEKQVKEYLSSGCTPTSNQLKIYAASSPFLDWIDAEIEKSEVSDGTKKHYRTLLSTLNSYGKIRKFDDVNAKNLTDFLNYVKKSKNAQKVENGVITEHSIRQTTIRNYYKNFVKFVHLAQSRHLLPLDAVVGVKCDRGKNKLREHLSEAELKAWLEVPLQVPHLARVRDMFAIQCATGLAYSDLLSMDFSRIEKFGNQYALAGERIKTKKDFFLVVLDFAIPILERYNYTIPRIANQKYNDYLSAVANIAGIKKHITTHVGRHTYACICLSRGVRIEAVQKTLGHAKISTTQIYANLVNQDVLNSFASAFSPNNIDANSKRKK